MRRYFHGEDLDALERVRKEIEARTSYGLQTHFRWSAAQAADALSRETAIFALIWNNPDVKSADQVCYPEAQLNLARVKLLCK